MTVLAGFRAETVRQDIALITTLREHLVILTEPPSLRLLSLAISMPITNSQVSSTIGSSRNTTWYQLAKLTGLGMLDKRGFEYRISPYALNLIGAEALALRAVVNGKMPKVRESNEWSDILKIAAEGTESLYVRGTIDQTEHSRRLKLIHDMEISLRNP